MDDNLRRELQRNFRENVFETLQLIASAEKQMGYQADVPIAHVSAELFCQWEDAYQLPNSQDWYEDAFSTKEFSVLRNFDTLFEKVARAVPDDLPVIQDFIKTQHWKTLSEAAQEALNQLHAKH